MNIPNCITLLRILLIPLLVIFLIEGKMQLALLAFVAAGISDALDGFLARILHQKTAFGAFVDPIADKLLLITSFVTLAVLGDLPKWIAVLVVSRDVIIMGGIGILLFSKRPITFKPTYDGKMTTFLQLMTVFYVLGLAYIPANLHFAGEYLVYLTAAFTLFSGGRYIAMGFRILGRPE